MSVIMRDTPVAEMPKRRAVSEKFRVCEMDRNSSMARNLSMNPPDFAVQIFSFFHYQFWLSA
jgi:hypothetical protein